MSSACTSPFQEIMPDEVNILSYLGEEDLKAMACTSKKFESLSKDFQIWKPKVEKEFGIIVADGAKESNKSWKYTYEELVSSRKARRANVTLVLQAQIKKTKMDNLNHRINSIMNGIMGVGMPNSDAHYYPAGNIRCIGDRTIKVFKLY